MRKSKADQTVEGICIILSNISKGIAFLYEVCMPPCDPTSLCKYRKKRRGLGTGKKRKGLGTGTSFIVTYQFLKATGCNTLMEKGSAFGNIDLFSLYVLFSHFRPRDFLMGIFLLSFHKLCVHLHVHKTTLERNYSLE